MLSAPLVWLLVVFALAAPLALRSQVSPGSPESRTGTVVQMQAAPAESMQTPDDDTGGSPGVLALPPKIHLVVNRTGTGTAPPAPVLAVLPAPVDRTGAGLRIATDRAGTAPAAAPPPNSRWGRAPPRA